MRARPLSKHRAVLAERLGRLLDAREPVKVQLVLPLAQLVMLFQEAARSRLALLPRLLAVEKWLLPDRSGKVRPERALLALQPQHLYLINPEP